MLIKIKDSTEEDIIEEYIGNEYYKCIYLYLDLKKYGIKNNNVKVWIQYNLNKEITAVLLKYYSGMHVFSKNYDYENKEITKLIVDEKPTMLCGEKTIITDLYKNLKELNYNLEIGWVRELSNIESINRTCVEKAEIVDFYQIAKLLYEDEDLGCSYKLEELKNQMIERNQEGFVRNYIIKNEYCNVIAHAGTGAENENVAMLSYVITDPKYRGKGYAKKLCSAVCEDLIKEGKKVYLINYSSESTALYDKIGFKICCEWGKLFMNLKSN